MINSFTRLHLALAILMTGISQASCNNADKQKETTIIDQPPSVLLFDKMVGTWKNDNGKSFEQWSKNSDGSFLALAFSINGGDTSWNERATIVLDNGKWIFTNTVSGQNEGQAVKFVSTFITDTSVQFSNPAHDFPTDINYSLSDNNTLRAFIVGPNNTGGKDTIPFNYKRVI